MALTETPPLLKMLCVVEDLRAPCDDDLEVDGCAVSLGDTDTALGVVASRFFLRPYVWMARQPVCL
ncbi:MAG: hypothetical protein A2V70_01420 [Planctomycetes bacterium RBG_13_63_9]|nr:MAG: hypothetical protein A2V70_01420 [Planctomycetes bacterium RBG_13_63_9]